jgi:hypothetical protein
MAGQGVTIGAKLQIDTGEATKSVGSIKKELREANQELLSAQHTFGDFSAEAQTAAKRVAQLKDRIGDARDFAESFNPDKKFQAFGGAIAGVTGGFTALTGVMGLFGVKSDEVEKTLLKVQSALALSQGLDQIRSSIDQFKNLGNQIKNVTLFKKADAAATKLATGIQKLFGMEVNTTSKSFGGLKTAIAATGIGLLVVGLGLAVQWLQELGNAAEEAAEKEKALQEQTVELAKAGLEGETAFTDRQEKLEVARAKAAGKSEEEIFQIQQRYNKVRVGSAVRYWNEVKGVDGEGYKAKKAAEDIALDGELNRLAFVAKQREEQERKNKEAAQKALDKQKDLNRQKIEDEKAALKLIEDLRLNARLANTGSEKDQDLIKLKADFEEKKKILIKGHQELNALEDWFNAERGKIIRKYDDDDRQIFLEALETAQKLREEADAKRIENLKAEVDGHREAALAIANNDQMSITERSNALDIAAKSLLSNTQLSEDQRLALEANFTAARIDLAKQEADAKKGFYQDIGNALGAFSDLLGKETAAGKTLAVAQASINTWLGVTEVLKAKSVLPEPMGTISKFVNVAAVIASGIGAIKNIVKVQVKGSSGGGAVPTAASFAPTSSAPVNSVTTLDRNSVNAIGNQAVKAYVLESDVTNNQDKIRRINRAARIG